MRKLQVFLDWGGGGENIAYPVVAANRALLEKLGIAWSEWEQKEPYLRAGCTITYLAVDWRPVGLLAIFMALNFAAILLAMAGGVDPVTGVLVRNAGSVFVIVHSAFVLRWSVRIGQ